MNESQIRRELRLLKGYALLTTVLLGTLAMSAFRRTAREKFTEIDVERINVVEPDGKYRMVISNRPRSIGPIYKGQPFGYAGGGRPGIIFFNDEGTENGGLTFTGAATPTGWRASTHMSFDQFDQDQVLNLDYADSSGRRVVGISMLDRANVNIHDLVAQRDSIMRATSGAEQRAALQRLMTATPNGDPMQARRVFLGREATRDAALVLYDPHGRPRIRLAVDSTGAPSIQFLDASGRVTSRLPESAK